MILEKTMNRGMKKPISAIVKAAGMKSVPIFASFQTKDKYRPPEFGNSGCSGIRSIYVGTHSTIVIKKRIGFITFQNQKVVTTAQSTLKQCNLPLICIS